MNAFQHTGISVADLDRSAAWYARRFGFRETKRFAKPEMEIRGALLQLGNAFLEILQPDDPRPASRDDSTIIRHFRQLGANHLAIGVGDVAGTFAEFRKDGIEMLSELIDGRFFFCRDPDCTVIEVRQTA